jgi:hypothetical protein
VLIDSVYLAHEPAFDADALRDAMVRSLADLGVEVALRTRVERVDPIGDGPGSRLRVATVDPDGTRAAVDAAFVFNCTYSGVGQVGGDAGGVRSRLKHEVAEMALVELPPRLAGLGVTVMDGPFFSLMPYPTRALHTLSHVRYTPHGHWATSPASIRTGGSTSMAASRASIAWCATRHATCRRCAARAASTRSSRSRR